MSIIQLGTIIAGKPSKLKINAVSPDGSALFIRQQRSKDSGELPQGLKLLQDGSIVGRTTFRNTTSFDKGTTTFSVTDSKGTEITTWDSGFTFTAEAYSDIGPLVSFRIIDGGAGFTSTPTVVISGGGGIQAKATCTIDVGTGQVNSMTLVDGGEGYTHQPTITFVGGGGTTQPIVEAEIPGKFGISSVQQYNVQVSALKAKPWQNVYCIALPHFKDRANWQDFTSDFNIFDQDSLYRKNDERFGLQRDIRILVKSGLNPKYLETYMHQLEEYHYTKTLRFGELKSARSYVDGKVEYEVIYYEIEELGSSEETLINLSKTDYDFAPIYASTGKVRASLGSSPGVPDYSADMSSWDPAYDVYPNSFKNMRKRLTDEIGEVITEAKSLPTWMSTEQVDGSILQYKTVVPIAYVKPGQAEKIKFLIKRSKFNPDNFLFQVDRYEWDIDLTKSFNIDTDKYAERLYTGWDVSTTTFDSDDMKFLDVKQNISASVGVTSYNLNQYVDHSNDISVHVFSPKSISAITNANPARVTTATNHNLETGDRVTIVSVVGMLELNNKLFYITKISNTEFELYTDSALASAVNSTGYGVYTSGGVATGIGTKLVPVKDYVAQFKQMTINFTPVAGDVYHVIFETYGPQTYTKVSEKDKYIKFPQIGVYE